MNYRIIASTILVSCLISSSIAQKKLDTIQASSNSASIKINGEPYSSSWTMSPEYNPDVFSVEVQEGESKGVSFYTNLDSITYQIKLGETRDFIVILNGDTVITRFQGVLPGVNFTDNYIKENQGKWSVEIIEAQELLQVILAITSTGLADTQSRIINHDSTEYYLQVIEKFLPYKNHPVVSKMDRLLQKNWYINLKADACALTFNSKNQLVKTATYDRMRGSSNLLDPYMERLNDFAEKSNFRSFFQQNQHFYDSLINWHKTSFSTKKQWDWMEKQFPDHKYDNYRILFSPLVKGNHNTVRFNNNSFKQAIMFIRPPYVVPNVSQAVSEGLVTRLVFTEIDHNYVNPETDKYIDEVNTYFKDKNEWTAGKESRGYSSAYAVFNEYMTWSVYLLYCYDQYNTEDFKIINDRIVKYIIDKRGFHRFDDFHGTMLSLYSNKKADETVADLYPALLKWASTYD